MSKIANFFKKIFIGPDEEVVPCSASPPEDKPITYNDLIEKGAAQPSDNYVYINGVAYRRPGAN